MEGPTTQPSGHTSWFFRVTFRFVVVASFILEKFVNIQWFFFVFLCFLQTQGVFTTRWDDDDDATFALVCNQSTDCTMENHSKSISLKYILISMRFQFFSSMEPTHRRDCRFRTTVDNENSNWTKLLLESFVNKKDFHSFSLSRKNVRAFGLMVDLSLCIPPYFTTHAHLKLP